MENLKFWVCPKKDDLAFTLAIKILKRNYYSPVSICRKAIIDFACLKNSRLRKKILDEHVEVDYRALETGKETATRNMRLPVRLIRHFQIHKTHKSLNALVVDLLEQKMAEDLKEISDIVESDVFF